MTLILELSPSQERELETLAQSEGLPVAEYALRRLLPARDIRSSSKPYNAMQFSGIAPTGRTEEEIDAEINAMRDEWDERERSWQSTSPAPNAAS